ncbi:MAG: aKG-HExxH-type peptide beta-hydroxylase [Telluria sp.]
MTASYTSPDDSSTVDFVEAALMPGQGITAALVARSARERIDDLFMLAEAVAALDAAAPHREAWMDATAHLRSLPDQDLVAIGSSPLFRRWLYLCGRALMQREAPDALDGLLPFVRNYTIGFANSAQLLPRGGIVETWDCKKSARAGADGTGQPVAATQFLPASDIVVRNDLPGLRVSLDETRVPERETSVLHDRVDERINAYPEGKFSLLADAAGIVLKAWPEEYDDWRQTLRAVVPRLPPAGWQMGGFTLSSMQGAVWINPTELLAVVEAMVHEQSHLKLRYLEEAVPMLEPEQISERFAVSWRTDTRPIVGIYEGVYVHIHCAIALARCLDHGVFEKAMRPRTAARMRELVAQAADGLAVLQANARFTEAGRGYLNWAATQLL